MVNIGKAYSVMYSEASSVLIVISTVCVVIVRELLNVILLK